MAIITVGEFQDAVMIGTAGRFFEVALNVGDEIVIPMWDIHKISIQQRGAGDVTTYATIFKDPGTGDWYELTEGGVGCVKEGVIVEHIDAQFMKLKFVSNANVVLGIALRRKTINTN